MRKPYLILVLCTLASTASAQTREIADLPLDAIDVGKGGILNDGDALLIPTGVMHFAVGGSAWVVDRNGGATAQAKAKYYTQGLRKEFLQGLAQRIIDDLATRLRAVGYTVKTWDDVKDEAEVVKWERMEADKDIGMPSRDMNNQTYAVAAPSDLQAIKYGMTGLHWKFRGVAKSRNYVILIPDYTFNSPEIIGEKTGGYKRAGVTIDVNPSLRMSPAFVWTLNPKGGGGAIKLKGMGHRMMTDSVGVVDPLDSRKTDLGFAKRVSASWILNINEQLYADAVMHAAMSYNQVVAEAAAKERK